jgi:GTP-binding protein EngB required for normal cell division
MMTANAPMDLREYERAKFELAELLRTAAAFPSEPAHEDEERLRELFARLAEDRFNLVVVGRFSRGKSSLMNAIMGTDRLPVGIVPLTSVITTVSYGSKEQAIIRYQDGRHLVSEISLDELPQYITQQHNPGNVRGVALAEVKLPAEILRRGFHFVDTPGLGSPIPENTRTTEDFLPEADAFLLVTSFESPLADEELRVLSAATAAARRVFVVVNKLDTVRPAERDEALDYVRGQLSRSLGATAPKVFPVSARQGIEAKRSGDAALWAQSGIQDLEAELIRFLLADKSAEFLLRLCDRVTDLIDERAGHAEAAPLRERARSLSARIAAGHPATTARGDATPGDHASTDALRLVRPCEICSSVADASFEFLRHYQYDLSFDPEVRRGHAERGGLCPLHTWQYASLASMRGICTGYPDLLERLADRLRQAGAAALPADAAAGVKALLPTRESCVLCRALDEAESEAVASLAGRFAAEAPERVLNSLSAICVPHLHRLAAAMDDGETVGRLMARQAAMLERFAEDMRRYATKHDAIRRFLASEEERKAGRNALIVVAGLRNRHLADKVD